MRFAQPLISGRLLRRYNRFLADIELETGEEVTAHCPNPGAMLGVAEPGSRVWGEPHDTPNRKLRYGWRLVQVGNGLAGIDTSVPNRVVGEALRAGLIPGLTGEVRAEVPYGRNSRVDFLVGETFVEVKNVHLMRQPGLAEFPDCVTARGAKHLDELADQVRAGHRAVMLYCIQRTDCERLAFAADLDPGYHAAYLRAREAGVEAIAWACRIGTDEIALDRPIPIDDTAPRI
ncbi:MAG: DNA/RNA nuclease SfsA [Pseudomonadota bacterium]